MAGVFTVMFTVLVSIGGLASGGSGLEGAVGGALGSAGAKVGSAMPESLLFALLWSVGGVLAAPYVRRVLGMAPARPATRRHVLRRTPRRPSPTSRSSSNSPRSRSSRRPRRSTTSASCSRTG